MRRRDEYSQLPEENSLGRRKRGLSGGNSGGREKTHAPKRVMVPAVLPDLPIRILFVLRPEQQKESFQCPVELWWKDSLEEGPGHPARPFVLQEESGVPSREEQQLILALLPYQQQDAPHRFLVPVENRSLLPMLRMVPNLRWADARDGHVRLCRIQIPRQLPLALGVSMQELPEGQVKTEGFLQESGGAKIPLSDLNFLALPRAGHPDGSLFGLALWHQQLWMVDPRGGSEVAGLFRKQARLVLDWNLADSFARQIALETDFSVEDFPESLRHERGRNISCIPHLFIRAARYKYQDREQLHGELSFQYGERLISEQESVRRMEEQGEILERNVRLEEQFRCRMKELGFRLARNGREEEIGWKLLPAQLKTVVETLTCEGWVIQAEGKNYRRPTVKTPVVSSGMDWFSLEAGISFDGRPAPFPALLQAVRSHSRTVLLDDGTYGILPQEWLERFTVLTELGEVTDDKVRFRLEQAQLIDAILQERVLADSRELQEKLMAREEELRPLPMDAPDGFQAVLRPYQKTGAGWLWAMRQAGLGACLADDMGLGKTVQVLAVLARACREEKTLPSLAVMPRSLMFNWQAEVAKFCPFLRVAVYWGAGRTLDAVEKGRCDLLLTTYGTLRNDVELLSKIPFDTCILDESQVIKNRESSTARAACCIRARHRIAMTGTPIENRLSELFSQLAFLNPGLFGKNGLSFLQETARMGELAGKTEQSRMLREALGTFLLRRTKEMVARDLPAKTEQVLWCEMPETEAVAYEELRNYYQAQFQTEDHPENQISVLAALTRLRQAACHPGLLNPGKEGAESSKMQRLLQVLEEILPAGHKVLIFSQFTHFLKLIGRRLEERDWKYAYLDGETRDRAGVIRDFQENDDRQIFLISLKAGGVGLNLTAADYVFLMDPWWNPAIEAQAIDRAYRIGQHRAVMAYRMITRGTVEEKVHTLQEEKRKLAASVMGEGSEMPVAFTRELLQSLL